MPDALHQWGHLWAPGMISADAPGVGYPSRLDWKSQQFHRHRCPFPIGWLIHRGDEETPLTTGK